MTSLPFIATSELENLEFPGKGHKSLGAQLLNPEPSERGNEVDAPPYRLEAPIADC